MGARRRITAALVAAAAVLLSGCSALTGAAEDAAPAATGSIGAPSAGPVVITGAPRPVAQRRSTTPCTKNRQARWIFVSLRTQHMWLCQRARVAMDVPITSGMAGPDTATPTGRYRIQGLNRNTTLTLNTGATYPVKYWIPFDAPLFGFHDSSWQHFPYGSARYKTAGSHGCVHVPLAAIRYLFGWADIGTPVLIKA